MALKHLFLIFVFLGSWVSSAQHIAIMGAMDEEIQLLKDALNDKKEIQKGGVTFFEGTLKGQKVVLLKAGIGKVNAAYSTAILTANFKLDSLIFTGVAGGLHPDIFPGDIVIAENMVQYDFGKLEAGTFETWPTRNLAKNNGKNPLYLPVDSILFAQSKKASKRIHLESLENRTPQFFMGTIATGDTFVSDAAKAKVLYTDFNALATEMEGAAVAQICTMLDIPYIVIRSCSDNANTQAHSDYFKFAKVAAVNSSQLVLALLENYKAP